MVTLSPRLAPVGLHRVPTQAVDVQTKRTVNVQWCVSETMLCCLCVHCVCSVLLVNITTCVDTTSFRHAAKLAFVWLAKDGSGAHSRGKRQSVET